ncbi:MAG TPA: hypothetical protein VGB17_07390 [Pyrinomonadaceae bacterium]
MDINTLDRALPLVNGNLTLTSGSLPGTPMGELLNGYNGGLPLLISDVKKKTDRNAITVRGTASFMNVPSSQVDAVFKLDAAGNPTALIRFALSDGSPRSAPWKFSNSFPKLPPFANFGGSLTSPSLNLLDEMALSKAAFVLSTVKDVDTETGVPLSAGLNFVGQLRPTGLMGLFDAIIVGNKPLTIFGTITMPVQNQLTLPLPDMTYPWQIQPLVPGIQLQMALGAELSISGMKLRDTALRIYSPLTKEWQTAHPSYESTTALSGRMDIPSAGITVDVTAQIIRNNPRVLLAGKFQGVSLDNLSRLADLANGRELFDTLPEEIKKLGEKLGGLSLQGAAVSLSGGLSASSVDYTYFVIGMPNVKWNIFPGMLTLENVYADFIVTTPFTSQTRSVSVVLGGRLDVAGAPFQVSTRMPGFAVRASLEDDTTLALNGLFKKHLPELPAPPDLTIEEMQLDVVPGSEYSFNARMADEPPWKLDLGPFPLTISNVEMSLSKQVSGSTQGTFTGTLEFAQGLMLDMRYDIPGDFMIRAAFPEVKLSQLIARLNEIGIELPAGFDFTLKQSFVLITRQGNDLIFSAATMVEGLGLLAFTAQRQGRWGFAVGIDLNVAGLSAIPGLEVLSAFESFLGLDKFMLVLSSLEQTGFQFPEMANFNAPAIGSRNLRLPAQASGLVRGLNVYASLKTSKSDGFKALAKYLGLKLDGDLGMTLAVSLPDPATNSKLFLSVNMEIQKGTTLVAKLGAWMRNRQVSVFLEGNVKTSIQGQPVQFDVMALVVPNGVFISGTMLGTISFDPVKLSNLALVIGIDLEGIPSLGIAATLDVNNFESSLAVFFDSAEPSKSMAAGALSDLTLLDVANFIAAQPSMPNALHDVLKEVGLKGLHSFDLPSSAATALDSRDLGAISTAFQQHGSVSIPAASESILLVINERGSSWHLTDMKSMMHYSLTSRDGKIDVDLQPQFYCAPQETFIGTISHPQGIYVFGEIDYLLLKTKIKVEVEPNRGIAADLNLEPIVLFSRDFFALTEANGAGGPRLSLSTYSQPNQTEALLRDPHFMVSGQLMLLGLRVASIFLIVGKGGMEFTISEKPNPLLSFDLKGKIKSFSEMIVSGEVHAGIDTKLDFGLLGSVHIDVSVAGNLSIKWDGSSASMTLGAQFNFFGKGFTIPQFSLAISSGTLMNIPGLLLEEVRKAVRAFLDVASQWLDWVKNGIMLGIDGAKQIAGVLADVYKQTAVEVADALKGIGHKAEEIAGALKDVFKLDGAAVGVILTGIGSSAGEVASALKSSYGWTADQVTGYMKDTLKLGDEATRAALGGAGFAADEVAGAMTSAFGSVADGAEDAANKAKDGLEDVGNAIGDLFS